MSGRQRAPEFFLALLTTVSWAAVAFAAAGLMSWGLSREPVVQPVGPGFAFAAVLLSGLLVWLVSAFTVRASPPWLGMLAAAAGSYLAICGAALLIGLGLLAEQATSPFVLVAALLAPGGVLLCWALARRDVRSISDPTRPRGRSDDEE